MKSYGLLLIAALAGLILGTVLAHPSSLNAQGSNGGVVHVNRVAPSGSVMIYSGRVVGFACTDDTHCYVASLE